MKLNYKFLFTILFVFSASFCFGESHFDGVVWANPKNDKEITIYTVNDGKCNYYKGEATYDNNKKFTAKDMTEALMDYVKYKQIFEKVNEFEPVAKTDEGVAVYVHVELSPLKDRVYYIVLNEYEENGTHYIEWKPYLGSEGIKPLHKDDIRVNKVYGRWILKDNPDGSVYVDIENHNDWEFGMLPFKTTTKFEQIAVSMNIRSLMDYMKKNYKK